MDTKTIQIPRTHTQNSTLTIFKRRTPNSHSKPSSTSTAPIGINTVATFMITSPIIEFHNASPASSRNAVTASITTTTFYTSFTFPHPTPATGPPLPSTLSPPTGPTPRAPLMGPAATIPASQGTSDGNHSGHNHKKTAATTGQTVPIVIGVLGAIILLGIMGFLYVWWRRKAQREKQRQWGAGGVGRGRAEEGRHRAMRDESERRTIDQFTEWTSDIYFPTTTGTRTTRTGAGSGAVPGSGSGRTSSHFSFHASRWRDLPDIASER